MEYNIKIRAVDGSMRDAVDMNELQPGETAILEPKDMTPEPPEGMTPDDTAILLRMAAFFGIAVSDFIEGAAKGLGIPPCPVCQLTKQVLYAIKQIGVLRAMILLMKTFGARFGAVEAARIESELETAIDQGKAR